MSRSQKKPVVNNKPLDPDWQSTRHNSVDRAQYLFQTGLLADLKFLVGDSKEVIKAHKMFLAMTSPVFETMFYGNVPQPQPIIIPDMQASTFKDLLQYIYTNTIKFESVNHANWLYYAADKYMIPNLLDRCIRYVTDNLSKENVFRALEFGILRENKPLKDKCLNLISQQMFSSYETDTNGFNELSESTLLTILQMETMDMSELELFRAVMGWAGHQCRKKNEELSGVNMRQELNKVIRHIRFLAMTPEEFASSPVCSGILTESECLAVFMNLNSRESWPMPSPLSTNKQKRQSGYHGYYYGGSNRRIGGCPQGW